MRNEGDKIDFDKLSKCIKRIHLSRATRLLGNMLKGALGFNAEEVPFADKKCKTGMEAFFKNVVHPSGSFHKMFWYAPRETRATRKTNNITSL